MSFTQQQIQTVHSILQNLKNNRDAFIDKLNPSAIREINLLFSTLKEIDPTTEPILRAAIEEIQSNGKSQTYTSLMAKDWLRLPVDIEQFISDEMYIGKFGKSLYGVWRTALIEIFDPLSPIYEVLLTGAIGIGKNTMSAVCLTYLLYRISCMVSPTEYFGLMEKSPIVFGIYSLTLSKAASITFPRIRDMVDGSPYFQRYFPRYAKKNTQLLFPNNIKVIFGSRALHALSENILGFELDEANFMSKTERSSQAYDLYDSCLRRMQSRFADKGRMPGFVTCISSKRTHGDFLDHHIKEVRGQAHCFIADYKLWDAKPDKFSKEKFPIFIGDKTTNPRIIKEDEIAGFNSEFVIRVPESERRHFEANIEEALRDLAGISVSTAMPFLRNKEALFNCIDKGRQHPFTKTSVVISTLDPALIQEHLDERQLFTIRMSQECPAVRRFSPRFVHIDLSKTTDSTGFAMGHVAGVENGEGDSDIFKVKVYIDMMLKIDPPAYGEICYEKIRSFIQYLRKHQYPIAKITFDTYGSGDSVQILSASGYNVENYSVDRTDTAYTELRNAIIEGRISFYNYPPFNLEVLNLIHDRQKQKVDHPERMTDESGRTVKGSKDTADCVAAVVHHCLEYVGKNRGLFGGTGKSFVEDDVATRTIDDITRMGVETLASDRGYQQYARDRAPYNPWESAHPVDRVFTPPKGTNVRK